MLDPNEYLDTLHMQAEELADRAKLAEAMHDAPYAKELRDRATALVKKAARIRSQWDAMEEDV